MGMDRPGIEPGPSRMPSGRDATTPTAPELRRPRVLNYLLGTAFRAEALSRPPVRPFFFLSAAGALLWLALAHGPQSESTRAKSDRQQKRAGEKISSLANHAVIAEPGFDPGTFGL